MLRRNAGKSDSICDGFRKLCGFHVGRGFLPLLAVMLLAPTQLAFAQNSLPATVNPRSLDIDEGGTAREYRVVLDTEPEEDVTVKVVGAPTSGTDVPVTVSSTNGVTVGTSLTLIFRRSDSTGSDGTLWNAAQTVTVTAPEDLNAVDETVTLTHTATVGDDENEVTLRNSTVSVRVDDNDPREVTVTVVNANAAGELPVTEASSGTYTVVLVSKPTATVTVDVGGTSGEITASPSRLFFTTETCAVGENVPVGCWNRAQTVTVFAGVDFDAEDDTATLTHTLQGGDYIGVSADRVKVRVDDPDARGVTIDPGTLTIAAGGSDTYTVVLATQPTSTVSITLSEDSDDVSLSTTRLNFSTGNWNRKQTVTVRAAAGATAGATVTHTAASDDDCYAASDDCTVVGDRVAIDDVTVSLASAAPTRLTLSPSSVTINEGLTGTYTVRLASEPASDATVTVAVAAPAGEVSVDETSLTFRRSDSAGTDGTVWNVAQTVTVSAGEDQDAVNDIATVTHTVSGDSIPSGKVTVTVTDNDRRGVTVTPTSLDIPEGADATYTVVLDTEPTETVTVSTTGASGDVTVSPSQLTFRVTAPGSPTNEDDIWHKTRQVTVSAKEDDDGVQDAAVTLRHTVRGGDYDRLSGVSSVNVTITETDTRSLTVSENSLEIMEGKTGTYTVVLDSQPTGTVTVSVRGASGDVTVRPSRLIFTTSTWNRAQEVEVTAAEDADAEPDAAVTLTHAASGGGYDGVTGGTVTVTIEENDTARKGVTISPTALTVDEGRPAMSYTVVLNSEPTGTVTVRLGGLTAAGMCPGDSVGSPTGTPATDQSLIVTPTRLAFTQGSWSIPQTVTVRAPEDDDGNGTTTAAPVCLTHTVTGGGYTSVAAVPVEVTVRDNDTPGLLVTPMDLQIPGGSSREYTVALKTKPTAPVTVAVDAADANLDASPGSLTFTQANWKQRKTVRVQATANAPSSTASLPVTNIPSGTDTDYGAGEAVTVNVDVLSAADPGVAVSPTKLTITEGESGSYTVVLTKAPEGTVTVQISGASGDVSVSKTRLSFSTGNWNREQTVTVRVAEDDDAETEVLVTLEHEVTGGGYDNVSASPVEVTPEEDDTRGVTVNPTLLNLAAGVSGTYQVKLDTRPPSDVTVTVTNPAKDVTVAPSDLIFTPQNWSRNQTVTVTVDEDAGSTEQRSVTLTHTAIGGRYAGVPIADVTVAIPVEGTPGAPRGLSATGGDRSVTLSWTAPSSDGGSAIVRYEYRVQESGGDFTAWRNVPGGAGATSYTVTGLKNATSYTFEVRAVNSVGGGQSASASATLADSVPGAPANLTATAGDGQVELTWNAPADGGSQILRYEYRYAAVGETYSAWATVSGGATATSHTETGLTNGTLYGFQVRAVNSVGEGPHAQDSATPGRAPSAPTGLTAKSESETVTVTWSVPADDGGSQILRYEYRYAASGQPWSGWATAAGAGNARSVTVDGLTNGTLYGFEVRAVNAVGSGPATQVTATPMQAIEIDFAHFANGTSGGTTITSDIVLVNVETSAVAPAIYFYNQKGEMIPANEVVDLMGGLEMEDDGSLAVPEVPGQGEITISTNGEGALVIGSVRVLGTGRLGGVLRFDIPSVGVAGVGASEPVSDAIFPARRMAGGINTGAAIRNLGAEPLTVTCHLMQDGDVMDEAEGELPGNGHVALFIHELFPSTDTTDFVGSVRCMAADGGMFVGVALELDGPNGIFTTLPVVPLNTGSRSGESTLDFAHFANGDFGGGPTSSALVFVNVANSAVTPAIYFYGQDGNMIDASMVVDAMMGGVEIDEDGVLMVMDGIPPMGEMTISTSGMGDGVVGSVRVVSDGPIGGVLRFDLPNIGVAGVGASEAVTAAVFPARRMEDGINTGAAIRNLGDDSLTVMCRLMQDGDVMGRATGVLPGNGHVARFINELFPSSDTTDFVGSVHCTAAGGGMFVGVALELDGPNRIFTTLPVVRVR